MPAAGLSSAAAQKVEAAPPTPRSAAMVNAITYGHLQLKSRAGWGGSSPEKLSLNSRNTNAGEENIKLLCLRHVFFSEK